MALGDILKVKALGAPPHTFDTPVGAGNTLIVAYDHNTFTDPLADSVTADSVVMNQDYSFVTPDSGGYQVRLYSLVTDSSGSPVFQFLDASGNPTTFFSAVILEVEGAIVLTNQSGTHYKDNAVSTALSFSTTSVANATIAIGFLRINSGSADNFAPNDTAWQREIHSNQNLLYSRKNSAETIDLSGTVNTDRDSYGLYGVYEQSVPPVSFTITDSLGNPSDAVFGETLTVTTSNWGAEDPTHVDITGPSSNVITLSLTATATANEYTFTMPTISETEGSTVAGLLAGAGTIRVYTQV